MGISREEQDAYAVSSYTRAAKAYETGAIKDELIPVEIKVIETLVSSLMSFKSSLFWRDINMKQCTSFVIF